MEISISTLCTKSSICHGQKQSTSFGKNALTIRWKLCKTKELIGFSRILRDHIHKIKARNTLSIIARKECPKYPETFTDIAPRFGTMLRETTTTVLNRLVNYIDGKNQTVGANSLRRRLYCTAGQDRENADKRQNRRVSTLFLKDRYRPVSWQPNSYASEKTERSQEEKRLWVVDGCTRDDEEVDKVAIF